MSNTVKLKLMPDEFAIIHRILATSAPEDIAGIRTISGLMDQIESKGSPANGTSGPETPFQTSGPVTLKLSTAEATTLKANILAGVGRFQAWAVRTMPDVVDKIDLQINGGAEA